MSNPPSRLPVESDEPARAGTALRLLLVQERDEEFLATLRHLRDAHFVLCPEPCRITAEPQLRELCHSGAIEDCDLVLADNLADLDAMGVVEVLRAGGYEMPVLVLADVTDQVRAAELMRSGPMDCLSRTERWRLAPAITRVLHEAAMVRQQRQAEENARLLELACRMSRNPIVVLDARVRTRPLVFVNQAFEEMSGYAMAEVLGRNWQFLFGTDHDQEGAARLRAALRRGDECEATVRNYRKDGSLFYNHVTVSPLRAGDGSVSHIVAVHNDVTEFKQNEERARRALEHEHALNQIKSRFVTMVSHEFRTPLGVVNTAGHMLERYFDRMTPEDRRGQVRAIQGAVEHMTQMMEDFLVHGALDAGRMECRPSRVDLEELCRRLGADFANQLAQGRAFECRVDPAVREALIDAKIVRHIVGNLVGNALKYSSAAHPVQLEVTPAPAQIVDSEAASIASAWLQMRVTDRGIGIPAQDLPLLFQPFHRGRNVGNRAGTGMGMAIVKQAVDLHRGRIRVESEEGKGTTVLVWLPLVPALSPVADARPENGVARLIDAANGALV